MRYIYLLKGFCISNGIQGRCFSHQSKLQKLKNTVRTVSSNNRKELILLTLHIQLKENGSSTLDPYGTHHIWY